MILAVKQIKQIDEIPIIGVTGWTADGLAAKDFRRRPEMPIGHRLGTVQVEQGGGGKSGGPATGLFVPGAILD